MESLSKAIMESLVKDKKSEKTYHIGKKNFIKLAKAYCRYEMPKMNHVEFRQYQGTCWINFLNENNHPVEITLDKVWGKYHIRVSCRYRHYPLLSLDKRYEENFILLSAPSKTFNVAGLNASMSIIPNPQIRDQFEKMQKAMSLDVKNTFGLECVSAAYTNEGEEWMEQEITYMQKNIDFLEKFIKEQMPKAKMIRPQGTFLCWLDLSGLQLGEKELFRRVVFDACVICVPGTWFGPGGEEHIRINVGCPQSMLEEAMKRIQKALYK